MLAVLEFTKFALIALLVLLVSGGTAVFLKPRDKGHLVRLEQKIDLLLRHSGIQYVPGADRPPGVAEALRAGNKKQAVKRYREATGVGLAEAKAAVDRAEAGGQT